MESRAKTKTKWKSEKKTRSKNCYLARRKAPKEKESHKWADLVGQFGAYRSKDGLTWVSVCDREADIYKFLRDSPTLGSEFIVRATHNRSINKSSRRAEDHTWLWSYVCSHSEAGTFMIDAKKAKRDEDAEVSIRFCKVTMHAPANRTVNAHGSNLSDIQVTAIYVCEEEPPEGEEPLNWMLLTSLPVNNFEGAFAVAKWYGYRWEIEIYQPYYYQSRNFYLAA